MPNVPMKTLITLTAFVSAAGVACAQDSEQTDSEWTSETVTVDYFASADTDASGALDKDEFALYVGARADSGDADYIVIRDSGDYDTPFMQKDVNADGVLDASEITPLKAE